MSPFKFRRINILPPYVFAAAETLKRDLIAAGHDVIDLGFGNPDLPSPDIAVKALTTSVTDPTTHRYAPSRGVAPLREAFAQRYARRHGVHLDPESEVVPTIGMKEGFASLMTVLVGPGDSIIIPEPAYPMHRYAPMLAGAKVVGAPVGAGMFERIETAYTTTDPKPRAIVVSFPHNPTTSCVEEGFFADLVEFAHRTGVVLVHDFAYADIAFDGYDPPSLLAVPGAVDVAVELYSMTKGHSMAGWRVGFVSGNKDVVAALTHLKAYQDYGVFAPIQAAATAALNDGDAFVDRIREIYAYRRDTLVEAFTAAGWPMPSPTGTMFVWARLPQKYRHLSSAEFAKLLLRDAHVVVSPGSGFGPAGEGFVRFALVEPPDRLRQAAAAYTAALA